MTRRATVKRAKIRRDDDLSRYGISKRQARRHWKYLEDRMNISLLELLSEAGPVRYDDAGLDLILERVMGALAPSVTVTVDRVEHDRPNRSMTADITVRLTP